MVRFVSKDDLEVIAASYVEKYVKSVRNHGISLLRVDPSILAEQILGLTIYDLPLSNDHSILGMSQLKPVEVLVPLSNSITEEIILQPTDIAIERVLREPHCQGRRNFTIAHEVAHHLLWRTYPNDYGIHQHIQYRDQKEGWFRKEWQADYIAGAILMPEQIILKWMDMVGISPSKIKRQGSIYAGNMAQIQTIAQGMGVSLRALIVRLYQVDLLNSEYRLSDERNLDIWRDAI